MSFGNGRMSIQVNNSASPLIHSLATSLNANELEVHFTINGKVNLDEKKQGDKGADDFQLRIGLVFEGSKTLGFFQRQFSPDWVKQLFKLAPDGKGIDGIVFYNVYNDERLTGKRRTHPASDLLTEIFVDKVQIGKKRSNEDQGFGEEKGSCCVDQLRRG